MQSVTFSTRSISLSRLLETGGVARWPSLVQSRSVSRLKDNAAKVPSFTMAQQITKNKISPDRRGFPLGVTEPRRNLPLPEQASRAAARGLPTAKPVPSRPGPSRNWPDMFACGASSSSQSRLLLSRVPASTYSTLSPADGSPLQSQGTGPAGGGLYSVENVFKQPKSTLHNFYDMLSSKLRNPNLRLTHSFKTNPGKNNYNAMWNCTYCIKWPLEKCFTGEGQNKSDSSTRAALEALAWLKNAGVIDDKGRPMIDSTGEVAKPEEKAGVKIKVESEGNVLVNQKNFEESAAVTGLTPENKGVTQSDVRTACDETSQGKTSAAGPSVDNEMALAQPNTNQVTWPSAATTSLSSVGIKGDQKVAQETTLRKPAVQSKVVNNTLSNKPGIAQQQKVMKTSAKSNNETEMFRGIDGAVAALKQPKSTLHNVYVAVAGELGDPALELHQSYHVAGRSKLAGPAVRWTCTYAVRWPSEARFVGEGPSKACAARHGALQALSWLRGLGRITRDGLPVLHDKREVKELRRSLPECRLDAESAASVQALLDGYHQDVQKLLKKYKADENYMEDEDGNYLHDDILQPERFSHSNMLRPECISNANSESEPSIKNSIALKRRNEDLYRRLQKWDEDPTEAMLEVERVRSSFPIFKFRTEVCRLVVGSGAVVIQGEPGCGKSTQVPQFLLEHWSARGQGASCNIVVTQPRRISAIALAKYVAGQRQEQLGDVVGYQVRLNSVLPRPVGGSLLFCTTGVLLQRLRDDPGLQGLSHVVLDEAHERDLNTDTLLVLLRRALRLNPDLRLIVMSATINAELFQRYFGGARALHIPGFTHPVKQFFFEDFRIPDLKIKTETFSRPNPVIEADEVAKVIFWVDKHRPPGAILCFLPGWAEIKAVTKSLQKLNSGFGYILPLHSRLSDEDQRRIFSSPPLGLRKIILATNIAETSLTINDVVYVVDCGAHKEERLSVNKEMSSLDNQWVSQANVNQRKGRAGRVRPGESYHLFPRSLFKKMEVFPVPEVLRVSLEKTIVDIKAYNRGDRVEKFLMEMPEPPSSEAVRLAVSELIQLGVLDPDENLTSLGERILSFTTHPKLSKILIYASIFRCLAPALTICTLLSNDLEVFRGGLDAKEAIRKVKSSYNSSSDHLALARMYEEWEKLVDESIVEPISFCHERNLNSNSLELAQKLRKLIADHVVRARMARDVDTCTDLEAPCNQYARSDELVKAVLLSGFNTLLQRRSWDVSRGRLLKNKNVLMTESGLRATVTTESVNTKRTQFSTPFLTYFRQVLMSERRATIIRETSLVSPFALLLFKPGELHVHHAPDVITDGGRVVISLKGKRTTALVCTERDARLLQRLRAVIAEVTEYLVQKEGVVEHDYEYRTVLLFHDKLLQVLSRFLQAAGRADDRDEAGSSQQAECRQ
ncbi:ATP-dependent RNA helicase DHX30-like isoform X2 [Bacillus rossius redtenbacheri]|uniref:ATP-dependent RNA helicase DHX30-like isoform X2 n=1 Tax=Bacillus rossius redtenbacheri TaxID=93214 RepID=UPI002FDF0560